jgi:hypothetical protein
VQCAENAFYGVPRPDLTIYPSGVLAFVLGHSGAL